MRSRTVDGKRLARGRVRRGNTSTSHVAALLVRGTGGRRVNGWFHVVDGADGSNEVSGSVRSAPGFGFGIRDG